MMHPMAVLGEPVRRGVLEHLAQGEASAGEIATVVGGRFGITHPAVSQHLKVLREAGFTEVRVAGKQRFHRIAPQGWEGAAAWLEQFRPFWTQALDALEVELVRGRQ